MGLPPCARRRAPADPQETSAILCPRNLRRASRRPASARVFCLGPEFVEEVQYASRILFSAVDDVFDVSDSGGVELAIHKAKTVVATREGFRPGTVEIWHSMLFWLYPIALALAIVGVIWGILFALRRTGTHRLANLQTSPEQQ